MQFQVPQFIEIENKVIGGQLTLRQFLVIAAGAGLLFGLFLYVNFFAWIIIAVFVTAAIFAMEFLKISGRSLSSIIKAAFIYYWNPSFYLWKSQDEFGIEEPDTETVMHKSHEEPEEASRSLIPETFMAHPKKESRIRIQEESGRSIPFERVSVPAGGNTSSRSTLEIKSKLTRENLKIGKQVQNLWEKISTSKSLVPKREKRVNEFQKERIEAGYQLMRRATGEIERAKRVDFQ